MTITRRSFVLFSLCASAQQLLGQQQGIATRDVKAQAETGSFRSTVQCTFHRRREGSGLAYARHLWRSGCQEIHHGSQRVRLRFHRLRQRRLDGHLSAFRHAAGRRSAGSNQSSLQEQSRRHFHRRDREGRPQEPQVGPMEYASPTTTTTASTTSSVPTSARIASIATTAMERSPM